MTNWRDQASCIGHDPELWSPDARRDSSEVARQICSLCPVRTQCLEQAVKSCESGIWGGLDDAERKGLKRGRTMKLAAVIGRRDEVARYTADGRTAKAIGLLLGIPVHVVYEDRRVIAMRP